LSAELYKQNPDRTFSKTNLGIHGFESSQFETPQLNFGQYSGDSRPDIFISSVARKNGGYSRYIGVLEAVDNQSIALSGGGLNYDKVTLTGPVNKTIENLSEVRFDNLPNGIYTITPTARFERVIPSSMTVTVNNANLDALNFVWEDIPEGVSINDAALYTTSLNVTLSIVPPGRASSMMISNDGGFADAKWIPVKTTLPWKLRSGYSDRSTRIVYARFDYGHDYSDDIIFDSEAPAISSAECSSAPDNSGPEKTKKRWHVKLRASDTKSGVSKMQFQIGRSNSDWLKYKKESFVEGVGKVSKVRVMDKAGNSSSWKTVALR